MITNSKLIIKIKKLYKFKIKQMIAIKKLIMKNCIIRTQIIKQIIVHNKLRMIVKHLFTYKMKQIIWQQIIINNKIKLKMNNQIYKTIKTQRVMLLKIFQIQQMTFKINEIIQIINRKIKQKNMNNKFTIKIKKSNT